LASSEHSSEQNFLRQEGIGRAQFEHIPDCGSQFVVLVVLLLWIEWRFPSPWNVQLGLNRHWAQLNRIEAQVRGVPLETIEEEEKQCIENESASIRAEEWWERWVSDRSLIFMIWRSIGKSKDH